MILRKFLLLCVVGVIFGCGSVERSKIVRGGERKIRVWCVEGGEEVEYEWVLLGRGDLPYDVEKGLWDFVGLRLRDEEVVRVVSSGCRVVMSVYGGGGV